MSEEEIIDVLENVFIFKNTNDNFTDLDLKAIEGLLDLYSKQQKEIEELKEQIKQEKEKNRQCKMRNVQLEKEITARIEDVNKYYISKDKIRNKIVECNEEIRTNNNDEIGAIFTIKKLQILEELLGE